MKIETDIQDFIHFNSGWSLSPYEIYLSIKNVTFENKLKILEFGSGDGTTKLVDFLNKKNVIFCYTSVEHDKSFAKTPNVDYITYDLSNGYNLSEIENVDLHLEKIYDLVIVDGPNGIGRCVWYSKIKNNVREGTIILVDDFHHYKEFSLELDKNFEYEVINLYNQNLSFSAEKINEGLEIVDNFSSNLVGDKSYKIVRITKIKD
jgi:hypothetical protein